MLGWIARLTGGLCFVCVYDWLLVLASLYNWLPVLRFPVELVACSQGGPGLLVELVACACAAFYNWLPVLALPV